MVTYFENLIIELHILYVFKTYIKFNINQMFFTIRSIKKKFFIILDYKNSKFKYLIDDITINIWFYWYLVNIEDIRRKRDPIVDLSKFTFNKKKILSRVATLMYNHFGEEETQLTFIKKDQLKEALSKLILKCSREGGFQETWVCR